MIYQRIAAPLADDCRSITLFSPIPGNSMIKFAYALAALLLCCAPLTSCSGDQENKEKGVIEQGTDKVAKEAVERIKTPLEQARTAAEQENKRAEQVEAQAENK
jgi:hypothetical protein